MVRSHGRCHYDLSSNGRSDALSPVATMIHQNPEANDKIITVIIHQKSVPKSKHIYNHYPSYIVHPPYIKSKYQKASYICKLIHHTMFMITIHCLSTVHQKSVVHPPYNKFISSNLGRLRCCSTRSGGDISSLM
jgi:hypothetical protein